jgi:tetratricopeptide (TPR) repeat protein
MPSQDDNCAFEAAPALDAGSFCSSPEPCESYAAGELLSWQQKDALVCRLDEQLQTLAGRLEQIESGVRLFQPLSQQDATARRLETQLNELRGQQKQVEVALRVKRATLLAQMGRSLEARADYLKAAELDPTNRLNLIGLGCLLAATGQRRAARTVYAEAVKHHPDDVVIRVSLGALMLEEGDPAGARAHYEAALRINPEYPQAHGGMYYALTRLGEPEAADFHHRKCFEQQRVIPTLYKGKSPAIPVLLMASSVGGNAPLEKFLDDCVFQTYVAVTDFYDEKTPLPAHRLVVNGIGDADVAAAALAGAEHLLAHTAARVINAPAAIQGTGRCDVARRLSGLPGVVTPRMVTLPREALAAPDAGTTLTLHGFEFPLLARTPGFHIGEHFLRVESLDELPAALAQLPGRDLTVIEYLDARGRDGKARKYRVMMIDGQLYPLHAAISSDWKIHYFSAEVAENPAHRAEDAEFLSNMSGVLGPRAVSALDGIQKTLGLDYGGVDFGLNEKGEILLFEANATMAVIPPDADSRWDYRRPAVELVRSAVSKMLMERAMTLFNTEQTA